MQDSGDASIAQIELLASTRHELGLVTKVCYYLEFSYIYKQLIINKKALCLIAEGCTFSVHITNWASITYVVLFSTLNGLTVKIQSTLLSNIIKVIV